MATPVIFATTYIVTTELLPEGRPWLAATVRSLPTGLALVLGSRPPPAGWRLRILVLSALYSSAFFPLLFLAAYRLPGGVASMINSIGPPVVVALSVPLLGSRLRGSDVGAGALGMLGVGLLVLQAQTRLDPVGVASMCISTVMMSTGNVLVKRWGRPPGMTTAQLTGWLFLIGGLTLLPVTLAVEGLPATLTARNLAGFVYLTVFGGIIAYGLWFFAIDRLTPSAVTFLGLLNPVVAASIGWIVLDQALTGWQLLGAGLVVVSVLLGQLPARSPDGRRPPPGTDPAPSGHGP